ncbi:MAG: acetoin dehydrogenase dihydrolipoyllysine-residue acetyltransferase subunit [Pseudomonadota bacterium]
MPIEVIMPKVDMDMLSGRIVAWHVASGDKVEKGAPLFDIETDKAAMEVEAPASGILHHRIDPGVDVPIGRPVAWLYEEGEPVDKRIEPDVLEPSEGRSTSAAPSVPSDHKVSNDNPSGKVRATPLARKLASQSGVDLSATDGTGARGRVQAADVRLALETRHEPDPAPQALHEPCTLSITHAAGKTGTPIVVIHGFASDSASWAPLEKELGDRPIIRIDLPCHGRSPKRPIASFAALMRDIRAAFDSVALEQAHLIGHSLGGALALALADTRERWIQSLTLIAPAGLGPDINRAPLAGICRARQVESLAPWLRMLVADETIISDNYAHAAMSQRQDSALRTSQMALLETLFPDGVQAFDLRAALRRIDVPTRIIWGKRDAIIPWRHAFRAPGEVALHLYEDVGHLPQIEAPQEVGKILRRLL